MVSLSTPRYHEAWPATALVTRGDDGRSAARARNTMRPKRRGFGKAFCNEQASSRGRTTSGEEKEEDAARGRAVKAKSDNSAQIDSAACRRGRPRRARAQKGMIATAGRM